MSATIEAPRGLDTLDASERALYEAMRDDDGRADPALPDAPEAAVSPAPDGGRSGDEGPWIDLDSPELAGVAPVSREPSDHQRRVEAAEARALAAERARETQEAVFQARLDMLAHIAATTPAAHAPPAAPAPIPDVNADPIGHFQAQFQRSERELREIGSAVSTMRERQQRNAQIAQLQGWGAQQEAAFMAREPAYADAMKFLEESRFAELRALGVNDPAEQRRRLGLDIHDIAVHALQDRADFAERLFNVAQGRGFRKGARPAPAPAGRTNAAAPAAPAPRGAPVRLTAETIANMPDAEFAVVAERFRQTGRLADLMGH